MKLFKNLAITIILLCSINSNAQDVAKGKFTSSSIEYEFLMDINGVSGGVLMRYISKNGQDMLTTWKYDVDTVQIDEKDHLYFRSFKGSGLEGNENHSSRSFLFLNGDLNSLPYLIHHLRLPQLKSIAELKESCKQVSEWKIYPYGTQTRDQFKPFITDLGHPYYFQFKDTNDLKNDHLLIIESAVTLDDGNHEMLIFYNKIDDAGTVRMKYKQEKDEPKHLLQFNYKAKYITKQGKQYLCLYPTTLAEKVWNVYYYNKDRKSWTTSYSKDQYYVPTSLEMFSFVFENEDLKSIPFVVGTNTVNRPGTFEDLIEKGTKIEKWKVSPSKHWVKYNKYRDEKVNYEFYPYSNEEFNRIYHPDAGGRLSYSFGSAELEVTEANPNFNNKRHYITLSFTYPELEKKQLRKLNSKYYINRYYDEGKTDLSDPFYVSSMTASGPNCVFVFSEKTPEDNKEIRLNFSRYKNLYAYDAPNPHQHSINYWLEKQGNKINQIAMGNNEWFVSFAQEFTRYGNEQKILTLTEFGDKEKKQLEKLKKDGFRVISICPIYERFDKKNPDIKPYPVLMLLLENAGSRQELKLFEPNFPEEWINLNFEKGFRVSTVCNYEDENGNRTWNLGMVPGSKTEQEWTLSKEYPIDWVSEKLQKDWEITCSTWGPEGWFVVASDNKFVIDRSK